LDDIRIYSKELNEDEIQTLFYENFCLDQVTEIVYDTVYTQINDTIFTEVFDTIYTEITDTIFTEVFDTVYTEIFDTINISVTDTLIIDYSILGVNDESLENIKIYPNPAKDIIYLDFGQEGIINRNNLRVRLIDTNGSTIKEFENENQIESVNINDQLEKGLYFINFYDLNSRLIESRKILIN
jgi:hypothetical protein